MSRPYPTNEEKAQVWKAYADRRPTRVPVRLNTNPRVYVMNPTLNTAGHTFERAASIPREHVEVQLRYLHYLSTTLNKFTDAPTGLPEVWDIGLRLYNVAETAFLGGQVYFPPGQVPSTEPILTEENKHTIFDRDLHHPLESGFLKKYLDFWKEMDAICKGMTFEGRPVRLAPWAPVWTDGPVTLACNLRGSDFLTDLVEDPEYADRLLGFVTDAAIIRRKTFYAYWGDRVSVSNILADDSCAMIGPQMYIDRVLPHHRRYFDSVSADVPRLIHLCGKASHLFPIIHEQLGVSSFDTGFPIDHGRIRQELGEDVEISGGPEVDLLLRGTPSQVYQRTTDILNSGIKRGGRFILQEGNNLPPGTPMASLEAMYEACLDHGSYN
ncbi:MAG: hypothetical protein IT444_00220 [Phycisphaeraceae bacterium]|nr:hypothetical protein [Phycisphaeraceae bacterium]